MNDWLIVRDEISGTLTMLPQYAMSLYYDGAIIHKEKFCLAVVERFKTAKEAKEYLAHYINNE